MRELLDITHAAHYLKLRERFVAELAIKGELPHRKIGKDLFFDRTELDAWWDAQPGHKLPATFAPPSTSPQPDQASPEGTSAAPIHLVKGPKTHVSAGSRREQSR